MKKKLLKKMPTKKALKKAIETYEDSQLIYKHRGDFMGVTVKNIEYDLDDVLNGLPFEDIEIHYTAKVSFLKHREEFDDCYIPLKNLLHLL